VYLPSPDPTAAAAPDQADLKTFTVFGVYSMSAITALTRRIRSA
jgi:hydroxymethylpyrimidine/phosphomethylpyrimidine kinase